MKILTTAEMQRTDQQTEAAFGVPLRSLMEHAGDSVARFVLRQYPGKKRITVVCGKGNNGGDGLRAARLLLEHGKKVSVILLAARSDVHGDAAAMLKQLVKASPKILIEVTDEAALAKHTSLLNDADLIVDAVFGTGFKPPMRGLALLVRDRLQASSMPVVAVDLPSGWDADATTLAVRGAFRADAVVTFTAPKLAHVFGHLTPGKTFGPVVVAPIGSPEAAIKSKTNLVWAGASKSICEAPRVVDSNKGRYGHVLVIGGARGKAGAPSMTSLAALCAGAGLVTAGGPECIVNTVARVTPELMLMPLQQTPLRAGSGGAVAQSNLKASALKPLLEKKTVIAIGPGLGTDPETVAFVHGLLRKTSMPMVMDADALNAFAGKTKFLDGTGRTLVLTPHPGEMARLLGKTVKQIEADRVNIARTFARKHHLTLVLKGWRTLIAHPDGTVAVNTSGNPAMAKGGSGDILTGIVAAMLAQFPGDVANAVNAAVYLHGLAGDFAAHVQDEHTVLATGTVAHLSDAFRYRTTDADGLTWIAGLNQGAR